MVLVFEDLHWADDAMLGFLEHLADRAEGVPIMIVGTARPELHEQHRGFRQRPSKRDTDHPRAPVVGGDCTARPGAAGCERDPCRAATADPRSRGWQPVVCRGVRPPAQGPGLGGAHGVDVGAARGRGGAVSRLGASPDRGAAGHAHPRCEVAPGGCCRDRQGVLGGRDRPDGRPRPRCGRGCATRAVPEGAGAGRRGAPRCRARPSMPSGTSSPETSPTTNSRARSAPRVTSPPPPGSKLKPPNESKTTRTSSPITTRPPSTSLTPRARQTRQRRWRTPPDGSSPSPENAPSDSTPTAAITNLERALAAHPVLVIQIDRRRSVQLRRGRPARRSTRATRRRRSRRRSRPFTRAATCLPKPTP